MINEEHHVALPKLYGAPAYGRPPRPVAEVTPRPVDEDDLPLEAFRSADDQLAPSSSDAPGSVGGHGTNGNGHASGDSPGLQGRPFSIRALSRLISGR